MENKNSIFDYCEIIFVQYGFTVIIIGTFAYLLGKDAQNFSSMFSLGARGLSLSTLLQFFILTILIVVLRFIFFTDCIIKRLSIVARTALMMLSVLIVTSAFIIMFRWFPIEKLFCWGVFLLCFFLSTLCSMFVMSLKEKLENKQLKDALKKYQIEKENNNGEQSDSIKKC